MNPNRMQLRLNDEAKTGTELNSEVMRVYQNDTPQAQGTSDTWLVCRTRAHKQKQAPRKESRMSSASPSVQVHPVFDMRHGAAERIRNPPTVHIARGYESHLPFLHAGRAIICISDWQVEPATQRHFWEQAVATLIDECGVEVVSRALVIAAGDMASSSNALRGVKSDAAPDIAWLRESIPEGDVLLVYGNHDLSADEHFFWRNPASNLPCLLPHGAGIQVSLTPAAAAAAWAATASLPESPMAEGPSAEAPAVEAPASDVAMAVQTLTTEAEAWRGPTAEQLAGLTKQQRAALWAGAKVHKRKAVPSKKDQQLRQHAVRFPHEAQLPEHLRALHASHNALRLPAEAGWATARSPAAAPTTTEGDTLIVGGVHGIPASHTQGLRKVEREDYFRAVHAACAVPGLDVLVTHANPKLAGQLEVRGEDAPRLHEAFMHSSARLHVHGHKHTDPAVSIVAAGKVVVNADCRVVVFVPPPAEDGASSSREEPGHSTGFWPSTGPCVFVRLVPLTNSSLRFELDVGYAAADGGEGGEPSEDVVAIDPTTTPTP